MISTQKVGFVWLLLLLLLQACNSDDTSVLEELASENELGNSLRPPGIGPEERPPSPSVIRTLSPDVLTSWDELFLELDRYAYGMRPNATARSIAYIHLAAYETVVPQMNGFKSLSNRLRALNVDRMALENVDMQLALNACLASVHDHFMINVANDKKAEIAVLEESLEQEYSVGLPDQLIADSRAWGLHVAQQIISYSTTDASAEAQILDPQPASYVPPTGDGFWTFSAEPERALFPYWGDVRTFVISSEETSSTAPIAYSEDPQSAYYEQMLEVLERNDAAKVGQNDDLWIAEFWSDDVEGLMMSPPGRQVSIATQLIKQHETNLEDALVLMLKLGLSLNDASVSTWADKYQYMVMRPNVYLQALVDPDFQTNLYRLVYWPNPSFPGYPSGHSCFASAAAGILINYFGDDINFTDRSHEGRTSFLGNPRSYNSLSEMAAENAFSRVPLGVHMRMDCAEGLRLGYEISDAVNRLKLRSRPS